MPLPVMTFIFLCFLGIVVIFFFAMRGLEKMHADMRDEHAQLRVMLRAMEARLSNPSGEFEARPPADGGRDFDSSAQAAARPVAESRHNPEDFHKNSGPPESLSFGPSPSVKPEKTSPSGGLKINLD